MMEPLPCFQEKENRNKNSLRTYRTPPLWCNNSTEYYQTGIRLNKYDYHHAIVGSLCLV